MEEYLDDKDTSWYDVPNNIVGVLVNPLTGELATEKDKVKKLFYFLKGTEPHTDTGYDLEAVFKEDENVDDEKDTEINDDGVNDESSGGISNNIDDAVLNENDVGESNDTDANNSLNLEDNTDDDVPLVDDSSGS